MNILARCVTLSLCLGSMIACAQGSGPSASAPAKLETEDQKTLYALGLLLGRNIKPFALKPEELAIVKAGLTDAVTDAKPQVEIDTYGPKVNELAQKRAPAGADEAKKKGQEFADKVAQGKGRNEDPVRNRDPNDHCRRRREPDRGRRGQGPLRGQAHRRHCFRQLDQARPARRVPAERRRAVLDGSAAEDEERARRRKLCARPRWHMAIVAHRRSSRREPPSASKWSCSTSTSRKLIWVSDDLDSAIDCHPMSRQDQRH